MYLKSIFKKIWYTMVQMYQKRKVHPRCAEPRVPSVPRSMVHRGTLGTLTPSELTNLPPVEPTFPHWEACLRPLKRPPRVGPFDSGDRTWTTERTVTRGKKPAPPIRSIRTSAKALCSSVFLQTVTTQPCNYTDMSGESAAGGSTV